MQPSKRTFGVEIECGHPHLDFWEVSRRLSQHFPVLPDRMKGYGVTSDGSGIEVQTKVLSGKKGYDELTGVMEFLNDLGCYVTRSDGMHVHVGAQELREKPNGCKTLARTWYNNQELIGRMCSNHRTGAMVCERVHFNNLPTLEKNVYAGSRYKALNIRPLTAYGRVEFRLHEGCLDPRKAVAWVQFCQSFVQYAVDQKEVITCASKTALLSAIGTPEDAISVLSPRQKQLKRLGKTYAKKSAKK